MRPLADDNEQAFKRAVYFVEATKPVVQETATPAGKEVTP